MKKQNNKKYKNPFTMGVYYFTIMCITGFFTMGIVREFKTYFDLKTEVLANQQLRQETLELQQTLENEKKNLTNPDYLEFVARGKYHVSRNGEQVFVFPSLSQGLDGDE
ncbi:MAG: septum formation initiator family protein [Erysipelotrichaceae bacterium]|nr:septum formation initiator family protein [Erysipelotrichaceae bacterium]